MQQLANIQDPITQDPKGKRHQTNQSTTKLPPKLNQDRQRKHGHHHIGLYCTHLPRGATEYPTLSNVEIDRQDELIQTTHQASCLQLTPFHDGWHQDITCLSVLPQSHSNQDLWEPVVNSERTNLKGWIPNPKLESYALGHQPSRTIIHQGGHNY